MSEAVRPVSSRFLSFYGMISLGALGAMVPYLGGRMVALGVDGATLGWVMAMFPMGRILGGPLWGWVADRWRMAGWLVRGGSAVAFVGALGLSQAQTAGQAIVATLLFSLGRVPMGPLIDAMALEALRHEGRDVQDYGRIRFWGSGGFVLVATLSGMVDRPLVLGTWVSLVVLLLSFWLPGRGDGRPAPVLPAIRALMKVNGFAWVCMWVALQALQMSAYDTFYSVHLQEISAPSWVLPASLAAGVGVELGVMAKSRAILKRIPVEWAFLMASLAGIPRWLGIAYLREPFLLVGLQTLHGLAFALFWVAAVQWFARSARYEIASSAQSLLAAVSYGLGALGGAFLAGQMEKYYGSSGIFEGLAAVGCLATLCALMVLRQAKRATF